MHLYTQSSSLPATYVLVAHAHTVTRYIMCALTLASTILKCVLHEHPLRTLFSGHGGLHPSNVTVHEA